MIIRKVRLAPFGGVADKTYTFDQGLNVLLGPNEAGKSTLINAIYAVLFVPAGVRKSSEEWKNLLQNCLPYPAGDTMRAEVQFETASGQVLSYHCAWGGAKEERMVLADGSEINDPGLARKELEKHLRFGAGTYKGVLFARQEEINRTFERLKENREALGTVSGLLRSALHESGGVSLEELETKINDEHDRLLQNWDPDLDGPRGGRDINNPHKKNVGAILAAYYRREELRRKLRETQALEEKITDRNQQLIDKTRAQDLMAIRLKEMEALEDDARQRSALEPKLDSVMGKETGLKEVISEWPRVEERVKGLKKEIEEKKGRLESLENELRESEAVLETRRKRELLRQARPLQEEIRSNQAELEKLPPVGKDELKFLEQKYSERERLKELAQAMKIQASLQVKKALDLTVTSGLEEARKMAVHQEAVLEGAGRLILESADWTIKIRAGEEDVDDLIDRAGRAGSEFAARLEAYSLDGLEQARATASRREELEKKTDSARIKLESSLGQVSLEELEKEVAAAGPEKGVRDPEQVKTELEEARISVSSLNYKLEQEQEKLRQWEEKYGSYDQAFEELAALRQQSGEIKHKLQALAPLPEEYETTELFFAALKEMRSESQKNKEQIMDLKTELAELQGGMPEESTEELQTAYDLADEQLERLKGQGRAIKLVREEFYALKEALDAGTYAPLGEAFAGYLALATNNRYNLAELDGALPDRITSADGKTLPLKLLSAGTASGAALALRLAMAEYLLQDAGGFLLMDDPLVNLDPERKQAAARAVRKFAHGKQAIIATCDPGTAELLGGNMVAI